jgi:hypothetical protein
MDATGRRSSYLTAEPQAALYAWLKERINLPWVSDFWAFGRVLDGKLVAVCGYHWDNGASCFMHVASDIPFNRKFLQFGFHYPFKIRKHSIVLGLVPGCNTTALQLYSRLGFTTLNSIEGGHPHGAQTLIGMRKDECRWLEICHGSTQ